MTMIQLKPHVFLHVLSAMILWSCGSVSELTVREFQDGNELVQMQYAGEETAANLVKEVRFYEDGPKKMVTPMKSERVEGTVEYYHPSGHLKETLSFKNGVQDGPLRSYDSGGILVFEGVIKGGLKQGSWTTWYDEVQKSEECNYQNGELNGLWTHWYIDGTKKRVEEYENGKLINQTEF